MRAEGTLLCALLVFGQSVGCYEWIEVRPADLPKLNEAEASEESQRARGPARLERPDGSLLEVGRNADVRVTTEEESYEFTSPVVARIADENLWIKAGNTGKTILPLSDVTSAEVAKLNGGLTAGAIVGGVLGTTLAVTLLVIGATWESSSH